MIFVQRFHKVKNKYQIPKKCCFLLLVIELNIPNWTNLAVPFTTNTDERTVSLYVCYFLNFVWLDVSYLLNEIMAPLPFRAKQIYLSIYIPFIFYFKIFVVCTPQILPIWLIQVMQNWKIANVSFQNCLLAFIMFGTK